jgi:PadR family transcriptional regulator AphA
MAVEQTLLGLLAGRPRHGYDLAREFADGTTLGDIVHLESGMLYAHLKKLQKEGWVAAEMEPQASRPPRRIFSLTAEGETELNRWLSEPVSKTRDTRLDFLLKLYTARMLRPELAEHLINSQGEVIETFVESLREQIDRETDDFRRLVLEMRLAQNLALLTWLRNSAAQLVSE